MSSPAPQKLYCTECGVFACCTREELRGHLECEHGINIETKDLEFDSMEEFLHWKLRMECDEKVFFMKLTGEKMVGSEKLCFYYTCCRSRTATKLCLSRKLGEPIESDKTCPASLKVSKMSSGRISVKFYMTHTGHSIAMGSHHLPDADRAMAAGQVVNDLCGHTDLHKEKMFSSLAAFNHHKKVPTPAPQELSCTECGAFACHTREELRGHLECEHGINIETKELEFDSMEEFLHWKFKMEGDGKVFFTKLTREKMVSSEKSCLYYTCHHLQTAVKHNLDRNLRESTKSVQTCPASLKVLKMSSGKISVKFYMTHTGHNVSMGSTHRPDADRAMVADQIVHVSSSTDGITVEGGTATMPWQQDLQHRKFGPIIVTVEQNDVMSWQQEMQHISPVHVSVTVDENSAVLCQEEQQLSTTDFYENMELCGEKMFSSVAALNHDRKMHTPAPQRLSCTECGVFACHTREELRGHLEREHGINIETKELEFDSMEEFLQWKMKMEGDEKVFFKKLTSKNIDSCETSCLYYTCHYSQTALKHSLGRKLRESAKSDQTCPASLKVSKMSSGKISVKFHMTHTGHNFSVGSLHHTDADRAMVAGKIVHVPSSTDVITVEEGSFMAWQQDLQHRSRGPNIVAVEENCVTPYQQELQHNSPVPVSVTVEENDGMSWQEQQHTTTVPVNVTVEENDALLCQEAQQHSTTVPVSMVVEENEAMPGQEQQQHTTTEPVNVTMEENDAMLCQEAQQDSTTDICEYSDSYKALCEICGLIFTFRMALNSHLRTFHCMNVDLNEDNEACDICDKTFSSVAALDHHRKIHTTAPRKLSCTECSAFMCQSREELRGHLECEHGINMEKKELEFDSMEQFLQWKLKMEGDEKVFFTKLTDEKMVSSEKSCLYYTCHHSRTSMKHSLGKRLRESTKIGQACPSSLIVSKMSSGKISVKFYMTHTCHNFSVGSLHFPHTNRATVAGQIVHGLNSSGGTTVEEDSSTPREQDMQHRSPRFSSKQSVVVEHNYAM